MSAGAAITAAAIAGGGAAVYSAVEQKKAADEAAKKQEEWYEFQERQAGEYMDLNREQMELQAQYANIKTLADAITEQRTEPRPVYTLPPAKSYDFAQNVNRAVDSVNSYIDNIFSNI